MIEGLTIENLVQRTSCVAPERKVRMSENPALDDVRLELGEPIRATGQEAGADVPEAIGRKYVFSAPYTFAIDREDFITLPRPEGFGARSVFYTFTQMTHEDADQLTKNYLCRSPDVISVTVEQIAPKLFEQAQRRIDIRPGTKALMLNAFEVRGKVYLRTQP